MRRKRRAIAYISHVIVCLVIECRAARSRCIARSGDRVAGHATWHMDLEIRCFERGVYGIDESLLYSKE